MALLVAREKITADLERAVDRSLNVLVVGEHGAGRTSLLRALEYRHRGDDPTRPRWVYVRAAGQDDAHQILLRVVQACANSEPYEADSAGPGRADSDHARPAADVTAALARLATLQRERPIVVLLDDVAARPGNILFGVLRDELWETRTTWVVTATPSESTTLLTPPANAFFETILALDGLTRAEATALLELRLPEVTRDRLAVVAGHGGTPRELIELARQVDWEAPAQDEVFDAARREWDTTLARLGRPASMLAAEMRTMGPVSASDEALLERMGWTRPRALQVLGDLAEAGLAVFADAPRTGPGRPRKVYRLKTLAEWAAASRDGQRAGT
ncbi:ATP-binding protein [Intrasporangium sp.]|uniref:ATP-binding protein n=1 Tax=Intrasporangium sp. TaxID=1925024 RepID=UPI0032216DE2